LLVVVMVIVVLVVVGYVVVVAVVVMVGSVVVLVMRCCWSWWISWKKSQQISLGPFRMVYFPSDMRNATWSFKQESTPELLIVHVQFANPRK
jgi:hypothetical protein